MPPSACQVSKKAPLPFLICVTVPGHQQTDNQLLQLRVFCGRWDGHELVAEYVDRESGIRGRRERKDFDPMFADAAHRFDVLLFWALDRFSRERIRKSLAYLESLDACRVAFNSHTEPFLDTDNELIAHIVLGVTSYYAQQEALRISDRTKAGLERARGAGRCWGGRIFPSGRCWVRTSDLCRVKSDPGCRSCSPLFRNACKIALLSLPVFTSVRRCSCGLVYYWCT